MEHLFFYSFLAILGLIFGVIFFVGFERETIEVEEIKAPMKIKQDFANITHKQDVEDAFHGTIGTSKYLGCFDGKKFEAVLSVFNPKMDISMCEKLARDRNYRYFGLSNGHVCMAGNKLTKLKKSKGCIVKCPGNDNDIGGGRESSSIFRLKGVIPIKERINKFRKDELSGMTYKREDLLMTVKGSPDYCAKYCNSLAKCKMFVYNEDDSRIGRLLAGGKKIAHGLQTTYYK